MNVALTPEQERLVAQKVSSGCYESASEVIEEGLRLLAEHDRIVELGLDRLREEIALGLRQLRAGQGIAGEEVFLELRQRSEQRRDRK